MSACVNMELEGSTEMRLLVVGKTGNGKSALCNTILGQDKLFTTGRSMSSTTVTAEAGKAVREGITLKVVDTPDVSNLDMTEHQTNEEVAKWKSLTHLGPTAILLAVRCDVRYTAEEYAVYQQVCKLLGGSFVKSRLVVAFTYGDRKDGDIKQELKTVCKELQNVLNDAEQRYVVFDNKANEDAKAAMVRELVKIVKGIKNHDVDPVDQLMDCIVWLLAILRPILLQFLLIWQWCLQRTLVVFLDWVSPGSYEKLSAVFWRIFTQLVKPFLSRFFTKFRPLMARFLFFLPPLLKKLKTFRQRNFGAD